jgi:hypothetical protein
LYSSPLDNFGADPVVASNGHISVFWLSRHDVAPAAVGSAQVLLATSGDDGAHFGPVRGAGRSFAMLPGMAQPGSLRDLTTPAAAAAPSGALYVAYAAVRDRHPDGSVDADIWVTRSLDHGIIWSLPERVNDVRSGDRFMPALSVLEDGTLGVAFYDRRAGPGELDVYATRVSFARGFKATPNLRVNSAPSRIADIAYFKGDSAGDSCFPSGRFFGDYIGAAADGTALGLVWADTQLHKQGETDLWFARVTLPALSLHVKPASARQTPPASGWAQISGGPRSLLTWFTGTAGHPPLGGLSGAKLLLLGMLFLLPALTVATALRSITGSGGQ